MFSLIDSEINKVDKRMICDDINYLFDNGIWCHTVPHFQTWPNLLEIEGNHWINLKNSFLKASKQVTEKNITEIKCWCHKSYPQVESAASLEFEKGWHKHSVETSEKICAILYLCLPEGSNGTNYKNENGEIKVMPFKENFWTFYPCDLLHKPGIWEHKKMLQSRMTIVVDAYF